MCSDLFVDTNIPLAYTFFTDPWHDESVVVFNKNEKLHYSLTVVKEFELKYNQFLNEHIHFFTKLKLWIKGSNKNNISQDDLLKIGLSLKLKYNFDENKKKLCIIRFWKYYGLKNKYTKTKMIYFINIFLNEIRGILFTRKLEFEFKMAVSDLILMLNFC